MATRCMVELSFSVLVFLISYAHGIADYCAENTFNSNSTWLQFTKEISTKEYAISGSFKSLHCCAKGYRSIEWYKDGKAYPWPAGVSNLILYPESANQTIYSQTLAQSDAGNYSCIVSNDTHQHLHTIHLNVIDATGYTGAPLPTYEPSDVHVELGGEARLFCEAFVGRIELPDAHNEVSWRRGEVTPKDNQTTGIGNEQTRGRVAETIEFREDNQVLGSHLMIRGVRREDFGLYVCAISNTWFQVAEFHIWLRETESWDSPMANRITHKRVLFLLGVACLALLTIAVVYARFGTNLRRLAKDKFGKVEVDDGKELDAVVCYHDSDSQFVFDVLLPTLQTRYNYVCVPQCITTNFSEWWSETREQGAKSRRLIAVVTPSLCRDSWSCDSVGRAIEALLAAHQAVVCVTLQPLPATAHRKLADGKSLSRLARQANALRFDAGADFWPALRLRMPPRRKREAMPPQQDLGSSSESLEVLV